MTVHATCTAAGRLIWRLGLILCGIALFVAAAIGGGFLVLEWLS